LRDADGKIYVDEMPAFETPWHHIYHDHFFDCNIWHRVMFDIISQQLPEGRRFVPSPCQQCWKVVIRPKTLKQLFALMTIEQSLGRPSKLGIETRPIVCGLYGGYFYNHSLELGLECFKVVREAVNNHPDMGSDVPIILKRACTEYEMACGPSDKWVITKEQAHLETLVNKWFIRDSLLRTQSPHAIAYVHRTWIEYAYTNGDMTYLEFTGGQPVYRPVITYHHLINENEETRKEWLKRYGR